MSEKNDLKNNSSSHKIQAVIMAAGKSTRTYPLTLTRPKPLLKVANKTLIEHNLDQLMGIVDEVILIVGYKKEMIMDHLGLDYNGIKITYVIQKEQLGTGHALMQAKDHIKGRFFVLCGDDMYSKTDFSNMLRYDNCVLAKEVDNPENFGVFELDYASIKPGQGQLKLKSIIEKPKKFISKLANTGAYLVSKKIFVFKLNKTERGEFEATDFITELAKTETVFIEKVVDFWIPVGYPWNLLEANAHFLENIKSDIKGEIEEGATIHGEIILEEGSKIMSGVYIEGNVIIGKNCKIGPNSYIRGPTTVGDNCRIGPAEIKACVFADNCHIDHVSYVGDSVFGEGAHLGAHTVIANLRHDGKNHKSVVNDKLIDTGRRKFGVILGDHTDLGINTTIYPGRKMWPNTYTYPGEIVTKDIIENKKKLEKVKKK